MRTVTRTSIGGLILGTLGAEGVPVPLADLRRKTAPDRHPGSFPQALDRLVRKGWVRAAPGRVPPEFQLTATGRAALPHLPESPPAVGRAVRGSPWAVTYDIPEKWGTRRDLFRRFLKRLGFHYLLRSHWVGPATAAPAVLREAARLGLSEFVHAGRADALMPHRTQGRRHGPAPAEPTPPIPDVAV